MIVFRSVILCVVLFASASHAFAADIFRLWHGVGVQGTQSEWSAEIDLRAVAPTVRYPSLKCSGVWKPLGVLNGVYEFQEVITIGRDACIDGHVRVFLLNHKRLAIEYYQFKGDVQIAKAVVFPGPHHADTSGFMLNVSRAFIASAAK